MGSGKVSRKGLKIFCGVSVVLILAAVITTLCLTVLKPKEPEIITHPVGLQNIAVSGSPDVTINVTFNMIVTIENPNYGSFKFKNSTALVNYHDTVVAEVPMEQQVIPAHGKINISTSADLMADRLISSPYFWADLVSGCLNFTSEVAFRGKVRVLNIFKFSATAYSTCDISVFVKSKDVQSKCKSKVKL